MAYRALLAIATLALLAGGAGCHALGFTGGSGVPSTHLGTAPPNLLAQIPGGSVAPAGSAFTVAVWAIAVTVAGVVAAFVVRILRAGPKGV